MNRIMGLDIGTKRIGIALSDLLHITAQPFDTIQRKPESDAINKIIEIIKAQNVGVIVAGLPLMMNGNFGPQAQDCSEFAKKIEEKTQIPVEFVDERLTSFEAEEILKRQGVKYTKDKGKVDMVAATIILQEYLDSK